jgi:hypothetical protein
MTYYQGLYLLLGINVALSLGVLVWIGCYCLSDMIDEQLEREAKDLG